MKPTLSKQILRQKKDCKKKQNYSLIKQIVDQPAVQSPSFLARQTDISS